MKKIILFFVLIVSYFYSFAQEKDNSNAEEKNIIKLDLPGYIKLNFGLNTLLDADESMKMGVISSRSAGLNYMKPIFLFNNFSFNPSLGISFENYSFKNNVIINYRYDIDDNQINYIDTLTIDSKNNKLVSSFIELPLEVRYYFGSGDFDDSRFFIGIGTDLGLRINSFTKLKHIKNNKSIVNKSKNDFGLTKFRYSASITIGRGNFNFYFKYFISDFFKTGKTPEFISTQPLLLKTGISFSLF